MPRVSPLFLLALFLLALPACQSLPPAGSGGASELAQVEGSWTFSHLGAPTVWNSEIPDPTEFMKAQFRDARIVLDHKGAGSMLLAGQAHPIEVELVEETSAFVKLRVKGGKDEDAMIYDKAKRTLMVPTELKLPNEKGIMPTYFRRRG